jgi:hypothetical protein
MEPMATKQTAVVQDRPATQGFDYSGLPAKVQTSLQARAKRINSLLNKTALTIGKELAAAREELRHNKKGGFEGWCETQAGISRSNAYRMIAMYEGFGNYPNVEQLGIPETALAYLASAPKETRDKVVEQAKAGDIITVEQAKAIAGNRKPEKKGNLASPTKSPTSKGTGAIEAPVNLDLDKDTDVMKIRTPTSTEPTKEDIHQSWLRVTNDFIANCNRFMHEVTLPEVEAKSLTPDEWSQVQVVRNAMEKAAYALSATAKFNPNKKLTK